MCVLSLTPHRAAAVRGSGTAGRHVFKYLGTEVGMDANTMGRPYVKVHVSNASLDK